MTEHPKVFISYSHDSEEHCRWVMRLAGELRSHGVDAILDKWDLRLGADLAFFMERSIGSSNLIICICSETYVQKANSGMNGVGYESTIIKQPLLTDVNKSFIIPVVRNNDSEAKIPLFLGTKLYIDFSNDTKYFDSYQKLLERIFDEDTALKPELGESPFRQNMSQKINIKTNVELARYSSSSLSGEVDFDYSNNNGNFILGAGQYAFETHWSRSGNNSIHTYGKIGYGRGCLGFPEYEQIETYDFSSRVRTINTNEIVIFENEYGNYAAIQIDDVWSAGHGCPSDRLQFHYQIYYPILNGEV